MKLKQVLTLSGFTDIKTDIQNESKKRERNLILVACNMLKMDVKYIKCKWKDNKTQNVSQLFILRN